MVTDGQEVQAGEETINALLSGETPQGGEESESETEQETGGTTEAEETTQEESAEETSEETEEAADEAEEAGETDEQEAEEAEEEEEEAELTLDESDRDYSKQAYEKAAKHYSRTHGVQLDPEDPAHRALLREVMVRGEELKRQREEREAEGAEKTDKKADEATAGDQKLTPEQVTANIDNFIKNVGEFSKNRVVPQVAMHTAKALGNAIAKLFWPDKKIDLKLTQDQANEFAATLTALQYLALEDAGPMLLGTFKQNFEADPVWGAVQTRAIDEGAFEHLEGSMGADRFQDMEKLVLDGTIKKAIKANPNVFKNIVAGDGRNPVANRAAVLEAAYKFVRGEKTLEQVSKAVQTGKKQAAASEKKIAAGRVPAGTSASGLSSKASQSDGQKMINDLTSGGGSRFGAAVKKYAPPRALPRE